MNFFCNAQAKSVSAKYLVGICNQDATTLLDTNVKFCSREYGNDGVILGQYKMKPIRVTAQIQTKLVLKFLKCHSVKGSLALFTNPSH